MTIRTAGSVEVVGSLLRGEKQICKLDVGGGDVFASEDFVERRGFQLPLMREMHSEISKSKLELPQSCTNKH
jgi:hypothetical protein